jgi:DNA polymerase I-like protein with 3'-5' exonuclease and polymerase domains
MKMNRLLFLDTETTIYNTGDQSVGNFSANPHHADNRIVYTGWAFDNRQVHWLKGVPDFFENPPQALICQNIAFDLLYLLHDKQYGDDWREWTRKGFIWDTMLAEYLITGQDTTRGHLSLDYMSQKYGGTLKDSRMKEYWENGVSTEDIPEEEIVPYLIGDVENLRIIYNAQRKIVDEMGMFELVVSQMQARLATIMMEYNGMSFDLKLAHEEKLKLIPQHEAVTQEVVELMARRTGCDIKELNPNSTQQLSAVLFGTEFKVKRDMPVVDEEGNPVIYKSGKRKGEQKTKKQDIIIQPEGIFRHTRKLNDRGIHPVGDDVLRKLEHPILSKVLKMRELTKQISTYFDGYSNLVWSDGLIHGNLNHCQTATGRLSSSNPNLQNISNKESEA